MAKDLIFLHKWQNFTTFDRTGSRIDSFCSLTYTLTYNASIY